MDKRIESWHYTIDKNTKLFETSFRDLTNSQMSWKPDNKSWSITEVIEHLIITSSGYFKITEQINSGNFSPSVLSKIPGLPKFFGNLILKSVNPNTKRKVKTMATFSPTTGIVKEDILKEFSDSQKKLHEWINENEKDILESRIIPSPLTKHFFYHFDTVIDILVAHQQRHFNQANNVLKSMEAHGK